MKKSILLNGQKFTRPKLYGFSLVVAFFLMATSALAQTLGDTMVVNNIVYTVSSTDPMEVEVDGFYNLDMVDSALVIPAMVTDPDSTFEYSVVAVGLGAFSCNSAANKGTGDVRNSGIVSVVLPETVDSLGQHAFRDNPNLVSINMDNIVVTSGNLFANCSALSDIGSLAKLTTMGAYTFVFCHSLQAIEAPALVTIEDGNIYDMDGITSFNIPGTVTSIGSLFLGRNALLNKVTVNWVDTASVTINPTNFFRDTDLSAGGVTLRVPVGTKAMYEANTLWGQIPDANIGEQSADASLSALTINGDTVEGFDPAVFSYTQLLPAGTSMISLAAMPTDSMVQGVEGIGEIAIVEGRNVLTVTVTAETGATQVYTLNLIAPVEVVDMKELSFLGDIINVPADKLPRVGATQINWWSAGEYIEYYVYAKEAKNISFAVLAANGTAGDSRLNVSTYAPGTEAEWVLDEANTEAIPANEAGQWAVDYASNIYFNFGLEANTPVVLRLYCVANANGNSLANVYRFKLTALDSVQTDKIRMVPTVEGDSTTLFSIKDHNTGLKGTIVVKESNNSFDSIKKNSWGKFQIKSATTGEFDVVLNLGSNKSDAEVYISLYNTLTGEWVADSDTANVNTGNFNTKEDRYFRLPLEADVLYTMQINFITGNSWICNVYNVSVLEYQGGADATLSEIMVDGVAVNGFDPAVMAYTFTLPKGSVDVPAVTAVPTIDGATIEVIDAATLADTTKIIVKSTDETVTNTYAVAYLVAGPYMGMAAEIPGVVQFEHWDIGGQGAAYNDNDAAAPRLEVHDTYTNVAYVSAGEWLTYTVDVKADAEYQVRAIVASRTDQGNLTLYIDDDSVATFTAINTGGWQTYAINIADTTAITAGEHVIKWEISGSSVQINLEYFELIDMASFDSLEVNKVRMVPTVEGDASTTFQFISHSTGSKTPISITSETLIESTKNGAYAEYQIKSPTGGDFNAVMRIGTQKDGSKVVVGVNKIGEPWSANGDTVDIVNDGNWNSENLYNFPITLEADVYYTLRISFISSGSWCCNVHSLAILDVNTSLRSLDSYAGVKLYPNPAQDVLNISAKSNILSVKMYSISGALVNQYTGIGAKTMSLDLAMKNGIYFVTVLTAEGTSTQKIMKK